jgi:hypothetical protein
MNEEKFKDPENIEEVKNSLKNCPTLKEVIDLIEKTFPGWIITFLDKYSNDYPHLETNWDIITKETNIHKAKILIVDKIEEHDNYELIQIFVQLFNKVGFIVREKTEIFPCRVCKSAIPHKASYDKMKELKINVTDEWSEKCSEC